MRPISTTGLGRRYAERQEAAWLLTLTYGTWTWRGATRAATVGGVAFQARLGEPLKWTERLPERTVPGGRVQSNAEVFIHDLHGEDGSLRDRLTVAPPIGIEATLQLAWLAEGTADADDAATMLRGRVGQWRVEAGGATLKLIDELEARAPRRIGRLLRSAMLGGASSPSLGETLPWVIGRMEEMELLELNAGVQQKLDAALMAEENIIHLESLDGFPPSGTVQIRGEAITYQTVNREACTLGTVIKPVTRGTATATYRAGETVRLVPATGFQWLVADHPCKAVVRVYADGLRLVNTDWEAATRKLGEWTAQIVVMDRWPLDIDGMQADQLTATVEGWADSEGSLIENPADVIRWLLTQERLGGLDEDWLDAVSFSELRDSLEDRGCQFARVLGGGQTLGELLEEAAREASVWIGGGWPLNLIPIRSIPHPADMQEDLDATRALGDRPPLLMQPPEGYVAPDALELVGATRPRGQGRPTYLFPPELEASGALPEQLKVTWLDLTEGSGAGDLGERVWTQLGTAPFTFEQTYPLGAALLRAGETARLTEAALNLDQTSAWVRSVAADQRARATIGLTGSWTGPICWAHDLDTYIRSYAYGEELVIFIAGRPVARLGRSGSLRLAGRLREVAALGSTTQSQAAIYAAGWVTLGIGTGESYAPVLRVDGSGNLELAGELRERSSLTFLPEGDCMGAEAERLWLSADGVSGGMEFRAGEGLLHLKGILIESVQL